MKKIFTLVVALFAITILNAQSVGYYNGAEGLSGAELKQALHEIIDEHKDYGYTNAKYILNYADEDPENTDNLIQLYSNRSVSKASWGTGGDETNREHVWAKSHGDFGDVDPMDGDGHNLHAADGSINITRSNYDFDEVEDGTYLEEAGAYYNSSLKTFEPADRDKGVVARTILYMAVRYEGTNGELDLEAVDAVNTSAAAEHGRLSTLLAWNRQFPPSDFERRRNQRVFEYQGNRNPFIDNPEYADLIWDNTSLSGITISTETVNPATPLRGDSVTISATLSGATTAKLLWGDSYSTATNEVSNTSGNDTDFSAHFLPNPNASGIVHILLVAANDEVSDTLYSTLKYIKSDLVVNSIESVQGTGDASPLVGQTVSVSGIVTGDLGSSFYIQSSTNIRSGILIYGEALRGAIGDSVVVTGEVVEYNGLTEISNVSYVYNFGAKTPIEPTEISIADINEDYEGMMVQFTDVSFKQTGTFASSSTYTIEQGDASISMYLSYYSDLVWETIPSGSVDVIAFISAYNAYQIVIPNISWITSSSNSSVHDEVITSMSIYPNPVDDVFTVQSDNAIQQITIYAADGRQIMTQQYNNITSAQVEVSSLSAGTYFAKIASNAGVTVEKITVK